MLFVASGIVLVCVALLAPIRTRWFDISPTTLFQRVIILVVGSVFVGVGIFSELHSKTQVLSYRYKTTAFSNVPAGGVVPGSSGAAFCALTKVDDDSAAAECKVSRNKEEWHYQTGGDGTVNACEVTCVWIEVAQPTRHGTK